MPLATAMQKWNPETVKTLNDYPNTRDRLEQDIDKDPLPGDTLIQTFEYLANGIPMTFICDGVKTLDVQLTTENPTYDVIEMGINGQLALVKIRDEIVLNRIDLLAQANNDSWNKARNAM